jgi:excisionase family DNA binding protein
VAAATFPEGVLMSIEDQSIEDRSIEDQSVKDRMLTPGEVAQLFRVHPRTVGTWARAGLLDSIKTPGGHRRFREVDVRALLNGFPAADGPTSPAG